MALPPFTHPIDHSIAAMIYSVLKAAIAALYLTSISYVHFRGKVRLGISRQLFDHSSFMSPITLFMRLFSKVPATPYLAPEHFPELAVLTANWEMIRQEALYLTAMQKIQASKNDDDAGFNSFFKTGWKRFYLKWYDASHPSAERFCPQTVALLKQLPSVKAAMFAELPPGGKLNKHRDPFAGSLRYHLGLITPNDDRCFIDVDGQPYSWRDGKAVVFDETFIHWAQNGSDQNRIILFCDVERPMKYRWAQAVNRFLGKTMMTAASSPNETGDKTGGVNKLFRYVRSMGQYRRRIKAFSKPLYYLLKVALIVGAVFLVIRL